MNAQETDQAIVEVRCRLREIKARGKSLSESDRTWIQSAINALTEVSDDRNPPLDCQE